MSSLVTAGTVVEVAPHTGARIETEAGKQGQRLLVVAPHAGATSFCQEKGSDLGFQEDNCESSVACPLQHSLFPFRLLC